MVLKNMFPGVEDPLIVISVAEKGWATIDLKVDGKQGHSSMPPRESAVGIMAKAISNLEQYRQPSRFGRGPEYDLVKYAAAHASFGYKLAMGNLWLFSGLISSKLGNKKSTDAMQRTTTAVTVVNAGLKENIIPGEATAVVNHRIHPADNIDTVLKHDMDNIDDERVNMRVRRYFNPPKVSSYSSDWIPFQVIANSALDVHPEAKVVPGILVGNTDTMHYVNLTDSIYRFSPTFMLPKDLDRFHGVNEKISVKNYNQVVEFYFRVIQNSDLALKTKQKLCNEEFCTEENSASKRNEDPSDYEDKHGTHGEEFIAEDAETGSNAHHNGSSSKQLD